MSEEFSLRALNERIEEVKKENEESTDFTYTFLKVLLHRYDLKKCLHDDHIFEDIPEEFLSTLREGKVPSKEEISRLDAPTQDFFLKDCVFICGLAAVQFYSENDDQYKNLERDTFEEILKMPDMSPGHHTGCYILAALTLLFSDIPDQMMVAAITNNFESSEEQIEANMDYFNMLCACIIRRHMEDTAYYFNGPK